MTNLKDTIVADQIDAVSPARMAQNRATGLIVMQLAATEEDWTISIENPVDFLSNQTGFSTALEKTFRCGYRAALPGRACA